MHVPTLQQRYNPASSLPDVTVLERGKGGGGAAKGMRDFAKNVYISIGHNTKFRIFQRTYRDDRIAFVYDCIPALRETFAFYQEETLGYFDSGLRRVAVYGPHGLGKTLVAALLTHHLILTTEEDAKVPTLASVWRQLEKYLWPEIHKIAKLLDWELIGRDPYTRDELMTYNIRTNDGLSEAFAVSAGDAALIEGAHASRLMYIFDESKSVDAVMWDAAEGAFSTEGAVLLGYEGTGECYWLAISTPGVPMGRFHEICSRKTGYEDWKVLHVTIEDAVAAGRVGMTWVTKRMNQWGETSAVFRQRVKGEFASDEMEGVIPLSWIEAAQNRWEAWDAAGRVGEGMGFRVTGVDTARYGKDKSAFAHRCDTRLERLDTYAKQAVPVTAGYLKQTTKRGDEIRIEMDSGLGASLYDILNTEDDPFNPTMNLIQVYMGAGTFFVDSTHVFRFNNTRSAAWWNMRELLDPNNNNDIMLYPSDTLLGDLAAPNYAIKYQNDRLTICVEPKDDFRRQDRLGRSPDEGDATVISFFDDYNKGGAGVLV